MSYISTSQISTAIFRAVAAATGVNRAINGVSSSSQNMRTLTPSNPSMTLAQRATLSTQPVRMFSMASPRLFRMEALQRYLRAVSGSEERANTQESSIASQPVFVAEPTASQSDTLVSKNEDAQSIDQFSLSEESVSQSNDGFSVDPVSSDSSISLASNDDVQSATQDSLNGKSYSVEDKGALELINYIANKAKRNQKPHLNQIKILTAATNAMEQTRANFNKVRVNVHSTNKDRTELQENERKLEVARNAAYKELGKKALGIVHPAVAAEKFQVGKCGEYSALDRLNLMRNIASEGVSFSAISIEMVRNPHFFHPGDHVCQTITYAQGGFIKEENLDNDNTASTVQTVEIKDIIVDGWAYGPAMLAEDYAFTWSLYEARRENKFYLSDDFYDQGSGVLDAVKEKLKDYEEVKEVIDRQVTNVEEYVIERRNNESTSVGGDLGEQYVCDPALLAPPRKTLQDEINFVGAVRDAGKASIKGAVELFEKTNVPADSKLEYKPEKVLNDDAEIDWDELFGLDD